MELTHRDIEIVKLVGTFSQLASPHLATLAFDDRSHSVPDRVLARLVRQKYLSRVGRRTSGDKGGAGAYVYQLGRYGRSLLGVGGRASPVVSNHALMIADTYVALRNAEKNGVLTVTQWAVELPLPPVRADLFVRVDFPVQQRSSSYYLEIDLGTERPVRLLDKIRGFWLLCQSNVEEYFPYVVFVVNQQARKNEIQRLIGKLHDGEREMVKVLLISELIPQLMRL